METTNIIANSGSEILYLIALTTLSIVTILIRPCWKSLYLKLSKKLYFNLIFGLVMECYLSMTITSILNLTKV